MKKYIYSIAFLLFSFSSYAQTYCPEIQFLYDASGNRYYRDFLPDNPCNNDNNNNNHSPKKRDNNTLTVYPNPAIGTVSIAIARDSSCSESTLVYMYDINGQPVFSTSTSANNIKLDVSSLDQGMYIIKVIGCDEQSSTIMMKANNISSANTQPIPSKRIVREVKY